MYQLVKNKIKSDGEITKLERKVLSIINQEDDPKTFAEDVTQAGCQSGIVGDLIYYDDTINWYKKYTDDIANLISRETDQMGESIIDYLNGWDKLDPLVREVSNQNLLAWWSFETVCQHIMYDLED